MTGSVRRTAVSVPKQASPHPSGVSTQVEGENKHVIPDFNPCREENKQVM